MTTDSTTTGGAAGVATTIVAPVATGPTTLPISANVAVVRRVFARLYNYSLTDVEASCVDRALPLADLQAIDASGDQDPGSAQIVTIARALARCEPTAFVDDQAGLLVETFGITAEQATCIGRAADALALTNAAVAEVLLDDWSQLTGPSRDALVAATETCVDHETAVTIASG